MERFSFGESNWHDNCRNSYGNVDLGSLNVDVHDFDMVVHETMAGV